MAVGALISAQGHLELSVCVVWKVSVMRLCAVYTDAVESCVLCCFFPLRVYATVSIPFAMVVSPLRLLVSHVEAFFNICYASFYARDLKGVGKI